MSELEKQPLWCSKCNQDRREYLKMWCDKSNLELEVEQLKEALKVAVEALDFYADENSYDKEGICQHYHSSGGWWDDYGFTASQALKKLKDLGAT